MTAAPAQWRLAGGRALPLDRARIVGILNVTPDSFSDGGRYATHSDAAAAALAMLDAGAAMIDVGGESTRPGAARVPPDEQARRVVPAIAAIVRQRPDALLSVDTTSAAVAAAALDAGACAINDVSAGAEDAGMFALTARTGAGLVLMHRLRPPGVDSYSHEYATEPDYGESSDDGTDPVVRAALDVLRRRAEDAQREGVPRDRIVVDPGLGFGKSVRQNYALIGATARFVEMGYPVLGAGSRKSFLGAITGEQTPGARVAASVAASVAQRLGGAMLFRVHDVREHVQALRVADAIAETGRCTSPEAHSAGPSR